MKGFDLPGVRLEVAGHGRVLHAGGLVSEVFELDVFAGNAPLNLYPNDSHDPTNHLVIYWHGAVSRPLLDELGNIVGVKQGADFRTRFWPAVTRRVAKAILAEGRGVRGGAVSDADLAVFFAREFQEAKPVDLAGLSIDEAAMLLTGGDRIQELKAIPRGTVANIDCDFDSEARDNGAVSETGQTASVGFNGTRIIRAQFRFPLATISGTVNDVDFQYNVVSMDAATNVHDILAYNPDGDDPAADTGANRYAKSSGGTVYDNARSISATGSYTRDLGVTADADVQANISSPGFFSLAMKGDNEATNNRMQVETIENAGTDPCTLTIDYTAGGGSAIAAMVHQYRMRRV